MRSLGAAVALAGLMSMGMVEREDVRRVLIGEPGPPVGPSKYDHERLRRAEMKRARKAAALLQTPGGEGHE